MKNTTTHGGARQGAGRPSLNQATITIAFRVPLLLADDLKIAIKKLITKKIKQNEKVHSY